MIKKFKYQMLIFILALLSACQSLSDFNETDSIGDSQIVVDGVLAPGQNPTLRIIKLSKFNDSTQIPVSDAIVSVYFNNQKYSLDLSNENLGEYAYNGSELMVLSGETYILEIEYHGSILSAKTIIPFPPENIEMEISLFENQDSVNNSIYEYVDVWWESQSENFYSTFLYCDSTNALAENYCASFYNDGYPFLKNYQSVNTTGLVQENIYKLTIYSMTMDYAKYYYPYNPTGSDFGYSGNIIGGYGIFTGINSNSITFQYFTDSVSIIHN